MRSFHFNNLILNDCKLQTVFFFPLYYNVFWHICMLELKAAPVLFLNTVGVGRSRCDPEPTVFQDRSHPPSSHSHSAAWHAHWPLQGRSLPTLPKSVSICSRMSDLAASQSAPLRLPHLTTELGGQSFLVPAEKILADAFVFTAAGSFGFQPWNVAHPSWQLQKKVFLIGPNF